MAICASRQAQQGPRYGFVAHSWYFFAYHGLSLRIGAFHYDGASQAHPQPEAGHGGFGALRVDPHGQHQAVGLTRGRAGGSGDAANQIAKVLGNRRLIGLGVPGLSLLLQFLHGCGGVIGAALLRRRRIIAASGIRGAAGAFHAFDVEVEDLRQVLPGQQLAGVELPGGSAARFGEAVQIDPVIRGGLLDFVPGEPDPADGHRTH